MKRSDLKERRFILNVCPDCGKVKFHSEWICLNSGDLKELKERNSQAIVKDTKCPKCS